METCHAKRLLSRGGGANIGVRGGGGGGGGLRVMVHKSLNFEASSPVW